MEKINIILNEKTNPNFSFFDLCGVYYFFRNNGMPLQAYKFDKGDRMYRWSSVAHSVVMPGFTNYSGSVGPFGQVTGSAVTSGGFAINVQCVVDIHADQNNNILKITPVVDTWGDWETSRCNEILK